MIVLAGSACSQEQSTPSLLAIFQRSEEKPETKWNPTRSAYQALATVASTLSGRDQVSYLLQANARHHLFDLPFLCQSGFTTIHKAPRECGVVRWSILCRWLFSGGICHGSTKYSMYLISCFFQVGRTIEIRDLHFNHPKISKNEETYVLVLFFFMCTLAGGKDSVIFVNWAPKSMWKQRINNNY